MEEGDGLGSDWWKVICKFQEFSAEVQLFFLSPHEFHVQIWGGPIGYMGGFSTCRGCSSPSPCLCLCHAQSMGLSASCFHICGFPGTLQNRVGCSQCTVLFLHYWPCVCKVQCMVSLMSVPKSEHWSGWPQSASLSSHWGLIKVP